MDWWQILLIVLLFIIAGLGVGFVLGYLIVTRLFKKPFIMFPARAREAVAVAEERVAKEAEQQARAQAKIEAEEARVAREVQEQVREEPVVIEEPAAIEEPAETAASGLYAEVEANRRIANEPWTGTLVAFQTQVWDGSPSELHVLPADLREDLVQAYSDMQLANSIVWLSKELKRRSPNLDENYMKLCTNIAARLEAITPLLKRSGK